MPTQEQLQKYAKLLVLTGCKLKAGDKLLITGSVEAAPLVRLCAQCAWENGAADVIVNWDDQALNRQRYLHAPEASFDHTPAWESLLLNTVGREGYAFLRVGALDPDGMKGVDPKRMTAANRARRRDCAEYTAGQMQGRNVWCGAAIATPAWAKKVFPDLPRDEATEKLWQTIFDVTRVNTPDPAKAWADHYDAIRRRAALLEKWQFDALHYTSGLGTDFTVGLNPNHRWGGGGSVTTSGVQFFPNMPTEETFTSPDRERADGIVYSSLPLNYHGLIRNFWIRFEKGVAVEWGAEEGLEWLQAILDTDENARRLGEAALVAYSSPISRTGILFYSTLFDENAACHLALGRSYPECLEGGQSMTEEQLLEHHMNVSATHVDFMIGTADMDITGITREGKEVPIFRQGEWTGEFA